MTVPKIRIIGAYPVPMTDQLIASAMALKFGDAGLGWWARRRAERAVRKELSAIALVEVEVTGVDGKFDVGQFRQPGSDQAAYDEAYLSQDGDTVLSRAFDRPHGSDFRLAFYLHYFGWGRPLNTSYGDVEVPGPTPMPDRLARVMTYEPVD